MIKWNNHQVIKFTHEAWLPLSINNNNNDEFLHILPLVTGPFHSCTVLTPFLEHTALAAISARGTNRTQCHLYPGTRYSFTPESSEACKGKVQRKQHRNNVPILRMGKHDISLKILHQAGFETARQAVTLAKLHALTTGHVPLPCISW